MQNKFKKFIYQPGRKQAHVCQPARCGDPEHWGCFEVDGPHRDSASAAWGKWESQLQSSGRTACETRAVSPAALTWPSLQSPSSCTPQSHSPWSGLWWHCAPGSIARCFRKAGRALRTVAGWKPWAGWQCKAERPSAAAVQRSRGHGARIGEIP